MKTVRRMVQGEVLRSVGFVTLAFLALFVFIDLVAELRWVDPANPEGYQVRHAVAYVATGTNGYSPGSMPSSRSFAASRSARVRSASARVRSASARVRSASARSSPVGTTAP